MRGAGRLLPFAVLTPLVLLAGAGCSSKMSGTTSEEVVATPSGGYEVETFDTRATITAIDASKRKLTLQTPDGKKTTFKASPSMTNFSSLQVGDQVDATVTEELLLVLWKGGSAPPDAAAAAVGVTPPGGNQAAVMVATVQMTATITAIDAGKRKVTFQFEDGTTKTYKAAKGVNLSGVSVGDRLTIVVTEGAALVVTKS